MASVDVNPFAVLADQENDSPDGQNELEEHNDQNDHNDQEEDTENRDVLPRCPYETDSDDEFDQRDYPLEGDLKSQFVYNKICASCDCELDGEDQSFYCKPCLIELLQGMRPTRCRGCKKQLSLCKMFMSCGMDCLGNNSPIGYCYPCRSSYLGERQPHQTCGTFIIYGKDCNGVDSGACRVASGLLRANWDD